MAPSNPPAFDRMANPLRAGQRVSIPSGMSGIIKSMDFPPGSLSSDDWLATVAKEDGSSQIFRAIDLLDYISWEDGRKYFFEHAVDYGYIDGRKVIGEDWSGEPIYDRPAKELFKDSIVHIKGKPGKWTLHSQPGRDVWFASNYHETGVFAEADISLYDPMKDHSNQSLGTDWVWDDEVEMWVQTETMPDRVPDPVPEAIDYKKGDFVTIGWKEGQWVLEEETSPRIWFAARVGTSKTGTFMEKDFTGKVAPEDRLRPSEIGELWKPKYPKGTKFNIVGGDPDAPNKMVIAIVPMDKGGDYMYVLVQRWSDKPETSYLLPIKEVEITKKLANGELAKFTDFSKKFWAAPPDEPDIEDDHWPVYSELGDLIGWVPKSLTIDDVGDNYNPLYNETTGTLYGWMRKKPKEVLVEDSSGEEFWVKEKYHQRFKILDSWLDGWDYAPPDPPSATDWGTYIAPDDTLFFDNGTEIPTVTIKYGGFVGDMTFNMSEYDELLREDASPVVSESEESENPPEDPLVIKFRKQQEIIQRAIEEARALAEQLKRFKFGWIRTRRRLVLKEEMDQHTQWFRVIDGTVHNLVKRPYQRQGQTHLDWNRFRTWWLTVRDDFKFSKTESMAAYSDSISIEWKVGNGIQGSLEGLKRGPINVKDHWTQELFDAGFAQGIQDIDMLYQHVFPFEEVAGNTINPFRQDIMNKMMVAFSTQLSAMVFMNTLVCVETDPDMFCRPEELTCREAILRHFELQVAVSRMSGKFGKVTKTFVSMKPYVDQGLREMELIEAAFPGISTFKTDNEVCQMTSSQSQATRDLTDPQRWKWFIDTVEEINRINPSALELMDDFLRRWRNKAGLEGCASPLVKMIITNYPECRKLQTPQMMALYFPGQEHAMTEVVMKGVSWVKSQPRGLDAMDVTDQHLDDVERLALKNTVHVLSPDQWELTKRAFDVTNQKNITRGDVLIIQGDGANMYKRYVARSDTVVIVPGSNKVVPIADLPDNINQIFRNKQKIHLWIDPKFIGSQKAPVRGAEGNPIMPPQIDVDPDIRWYTGKRYFQMTKNRIYLNVKRDRPIWKEHGMQPNPTWPADDRKTRLLATLEMVKRVEMILEADDMADHWWKKYIGLNRRVIKRKKKDDYYVIEIQIKTKSPHWKQLSLPTKVKLKMSEYTKDQILAEWRERIKISNEHAAKKSDKIFPFGYKEPYPTVKLLEAKLKELEEIPAFAPPAPPPIAVPKQEPPEEAPLPPPQPPPQLEAGSDTETESDVDEDPPNFNSANPPPIAAAEIEPQVFVQKPVPAVVGLPDSDSEEAEPPSGSDDDTPFRRSARNVTRVDYTEPTLDEMEHIINQAMESDSEEALPINLSEPLRGHRFPLPDSDSEGFDVLEVTRVLKKEVVVPGPAPIVNVNIGGVRAGPGGNDPVGQAISYATGADGGGGGSGSLVYLMGLLLVGATVSQL